MNPDSRTMTLWIAYATALVLVSLWTHARTPAPPPPPPEPLLSIAAHGDLDADGMVTLRLTLDREAPGGLRVGYRLDSETARPGQDFTIAPEAGPLSIPADGRGADLVLKKQPQPVASRSPAARIARRAEVRLTLDVPGGLRLTPDARRVWTFPLTIPGLGPPYRLSLVAPPGFRGRDPRRMEEVAIEFHLDRPAADHAVPAPFRIGGDASAEDFEVVDRPRDDILWFRPGEAVARLVLRRLPANRGRGDRRIRVESVATADGEVAPGVGPQSAEIVIPAPIPTPPKPTEPVAGGAEDRALRGHVLVILILKADPAGAAEASRELDATLAHAEAAGLRERLVDRSVFVLDGSRRLLPFRRDSLKDRKPFQEGAPLASILDGDSRTAINDLHVRLTPDDQSRLRHVLLIPELGDERDDQVIKALEGLPGTNWWVYWIKQRPQPIAARDPAAIRERADLKEFAPLSLGLEKTLLGLLGRDAD